MPNLNDCTVPVTVGDNDVTVSVLYHYTPGCKAYTPRGEYGPIDPPDPAEVDVLSVCFDEKPVPTWFENAASDVIHEFILNMHERWGM